MAMIGLLLMSLACACLASPQVDVSKPRNTIFGDERLEDQIFHNINDVPLELNDVFYNPHRLPNTTVPIHYDVLIATDFDSTPRSFAGTVVIQLRATQPDVNEIVIHAHDLNFPTIPTLSYNAVNIPITYTFDNDDFEHFLRISLGTTTLIYNEDQAAVYELTINFEAPLRNDMYGIYESWFKTGEDIKYMASTQFQGTSARFAFPCYDEPGFKATFDIRIRRPIQYRSWSCMNQERTVTFSSTIEEDIYYRTPIMSTYLVALLVAEYDSLPVYVDDVLTYEVIARPDALNASQGVYALEVGMQLLDAMNEHTGYNFYNMSENLKMTQAAIPDFSAGAMENWGLLTYREAYLLYDEEHTDSLFKQRIAYILSHEIAHMWFGNLVTCDWWDVLWLNEGFARYYQYYLTSWVETEMGFDTRFVIDQVHSSLLSDSANNPQPLTNPFGVGSPQSVSSMFSVISYNKGAALIRMTEYLLGSEVHQRALQNYLRERQFKTAVPMDLFQALQDEAERSGAIAEYGPDFSIIDYYKGFTEQRGSPVLIVNVNHATGEMVIVQRRFNINTGYSPESTTWIIPITFATASNPDFDSTKPTHIVSRSVTIINRGSVGNEWVIFNKQQIGFYRVNYDDYTWDVITEALRGEDRTIIHEHNRAQIVDDVFQFARSGLMTYTRAFNILSFLENETMYAPWVAAINGFNWILNRVAAQPLQQEIEGLIIGLATTVMSDIGYVPVRNETFMRSFLRYHLAPFMCRLNVRECREIAEDQFNELMLNDVEVPVDNRLWVYCNALRTGTDGYFDFLWNRFLTHNVYTEKILLLGALGCTPNRESLFTLLDNIVEDTEVIRRQDMTSAYSVAVSGNENNRLIVLEYVQENLEKVITGFRNASVPLSFISARLRTPQEVTQFRDWSNTVQTSLGVDYDRVTDGADIALQSIEWAQDTSSDFTNYLNNGYRDVALTTSPTEAPTIIVTIPQPELVRPVPPNLGNSATSTFISVVLISIIAIINLVK